MGTKDGPVVGNNVGFKGKQKQLQDAKMLQPGATPVRATLQMSLAENACWPICTHYTFRVAQSNAFHEFI